MDAASEIRVLLVEDDEDDYVLTRDILEEISTQKFRIDWTPTVKQALKQARNGGYDLCLLDYRLGDRNGIEVLDELKSLGFSAPILMLTGHGDRRIDLEAMRRGAADYLEKDRLSPELMERSVRYALERTRTLEALRGSEQRLRALSAKLLQAQEEERRRIAKELHDGIGANLTAVKYALETKVAQQQAGMAEADGLPLSEIITAVKETIEETQRISTNLRPSILDSMGLLAALDWTARKTREFYGTLDVHTTWDLAEEEISEEVKIVLLRLVQEAVNNAVKHSGADRITIRLGRREAGIELFVGDNGRGFAAGDPRPSEGQGGMGLDGMVERVELSGGEIDIRSTPGEGTEITARWPGD
jgi:signal transduction histidine kinase